MKKILSVVIMCALLVGLLVTSASAVEMNGTGNLQRTRINVKKTAGVTINGVIEDGEYEKADVANLLQWWAGDESVTYDEAVLDKAMALPQNTEYYFSWDGEYFNIAVKANLGGYTTTQTWAAGNYVKEEGVESNMPDNFMAYGPGLVVHSAEENSEDVSISRFYYSVGPAAGGEGYITAYYQGQNAEGSYNAVGGTDFAYSISGSTIVFEWKLPITVLNKNFTVGGTAKDFKISVGVNTGVASLVPAEDMSDDFAPYCGYGVRLGQFGWCAAYDVTDQFASFKLVDTAVSGGSSSGGATSDTTEDSNQGTTDDNQGGTQGGNTTDDNQSGDVGGNTGDNDNNNQGGNTGDNDNTQGGNTGDDDNNQGGNTGDDDNNQGGNTTGDDNTQGGNTTGDDNTQGGTTGDDNTQGGNTTDDDNTQGGNTQGGTTDDDNTQGGNTTDDETADDNTQGGTTENGVIDGNNENAAQTGDPIVIAAIASVISAAGFMIAKKRR